ncbi:hypothetical protein [Streptomyces wuyuanensis]|uniref:Uncharacterized protein n=1 Tax=Streptomyces wuyuanensis TaxID=1196353 RepID=A0A1G9ZZD3_9ACTN|nr:hypothetical protein [Streptomyces wuyuanensis]SDN26505.1 hypothetical protein SAMN05444921_1237 [Streptomyces wuyuanensis]
MTAATHQYVDLPDASVVAIRALADTGRPRPSAPRSGAGRGC